MVGLKLNEVQLEWLKHRLAEQRIADWHLEESIADASFRCYHRITHNKGSHILMHFLPDKEDGKRIIRTTEFFLSHSIRIPHLHGYDLDLGLVLQEDMGTELLAARNKQKIETPLYHKAIDELIRIQRLETTELGFFDETKQLAEMDLFSEWFLNSWLELPGYSIKDSPLQEYYHQVANSLLEAPSCCIHTDFHSRNIILSARDEIGIVDYQDACMGPICYDIVSLLRDAYIRLPDKLSQQLLDYWMAKVMSVFSLRDKAYLNYQFALMTVQRTIKVCGTFARLLLRDDKPTYILKSAPLLLDYLDTALAQLCDSPQGSQQLKQGHKRTHQLLQEVKPLVEAKLNAAMPHIY